MTCKNCSNIIKINNEVILKIEPPETQTGPYRLSGVFYDENSKKIMEIIENEYRSYVSNWDIEITGRTLIIRLHRRRIALKLTLSPPNCIIIEKIQMNFMGYRIYGEIGKNFIIKKRDKIIAVLMNVVIDSANSAIIIND